jgi:hypothetical protein
MSFGTDVVNRDPVMMAFSTLFGTIMENIETSAE